MKDRVRLNIENMRSVNLLMATAAITGLAAMGPIWVFIDIKTSMDGFASWVTTNLNWPLATLPLATISVSLLPTLAQTGYWSSLISGDLFENEMMKYVIRLTDHPLYRSIAVVSVVVDNGFDFWQLAVGAGTPTAMTVVKTVLVLLVFFNLLSEVSLAFFVPLCVNMWKELLGRVLGTFSYGDDDGPKSKSVGFRDSMGVSSPAWGRPPEGPWGGPQEEPRRETFSIPALGKKKSSQRRRTERR